MASFASNLQDTFSAALSSSPPAAPAASSPAPAAPAAAESAPAASPGPVAAPQAAPVADAPTSPTPGVAPAVADAPPALETAPETPEIEEEFKFPDEQETPKVEAKAEGDEDDPFGGKTPSEAERAAVTKWLKTEKGRLSLQQFKVARELEKPPSAGGLGFVPDAAQIKEAFKLSARQQALTRDFYSGDPTDAQRFIAQMFLPPAGGQLPKGAHAVAERFLSTLADRANAGDANASVLYRAAATPAVDNYIEELYAHAATMPDAADRSLWFNVARFAESHRKGTFREIPQELIDTGKDPNAPDPRVTEIDSKLKKIETFEQQQARQHQQQFDGAMQRAVQVPLSNDIDAALAPIREQYPDRHYAAIAKDFHAEVVRTVLANPRNLGAYLEAKKTAETHPTRDNIEKAGKAWAEAARPTIRSLRVQYINDALGPKAKESAERHKTLEAASQKRSAPSVAAPVGKTLGVGSMTPQRLPDGSMETVQEARLRTLQAVLPNAS